MDYSREKLIDICQRAFVHESKWNHDGLTNLMIQTGECYAMLMCGCDFRVITEENATEQDKKDSNISHEESIFLAVNYLPSAACEIPLADVEKRNAAKEIVIFALPTEEVLKNHPIYAPTAETPIPPVAQEPLITEPATPAQTPISADRETPEQTVVPEETTTPEVAENTTPPVVETTTEPVVEETTAPVFETAIPGIAAGAENNVLDTALKLMEENSKATNMAHTHVNTQKPNDQAKPKKNHPKKKK